MWVAVLLVPEGAPLAITLKDALAGTGIVAAEGYLPGSIAFGAVGDSDPLDERADPSIDRDALEELLRIVPDRARPVLLEALVDREDVLDLHERHSWRPPTLFEHRALADVVGDFIALLPAARVRIDRAFLRDGLNHCEMGRDGIARIRLLPSNGTTLAGRTHALVHEMGHALIGVARHDGRSYAASYGAPGYRRFLRSNKLCDEEALVRAIADAWLLRRNVPWARTWPGAIDDDGRDLDGDELARFARQHLARGLASAA
jgi:hypothetical protein